VYGLGTIISLDAANEEGTKEVLETIEEENV